MDDRSTVATGDVMEIDTGLSVHDVPRLVGEDLLAIVVPAADGSVRIRSLGVLDEFTGERSDLLLAIGASRGDWTDVIGEAVHRGARALVTDPLPDAVLQRIRPVAERTGLCLLERSGDLPWLVLSDMIRDLIQHAEADRIRGSGVALEDLAGLAESLAEMLGGPVIIEDAKFRVLSYSSSTDQVDRGRDIAILGRRIPDGWLGHLESLGVIDRLLGTDEIVTVDDGPFEARRRLLCSIRAERFLLGILWVAEGETPLPPDIHDRMAAAARTAAPFLLRHQEAGFQRRATQNRQMRLLLDQGTIPQSTAEEYGLSPADRYTVLGLRASPDALLTNLDRNRTVESVGMYCQSYRWRAATTTIGHTVYCVLAHDRETSDGRLSDFASAVGEHVRRALLGRGVQVSLSRTVRGLQEIPTARRQVDEVLETCPAADPLTVITFDDALSRIALSRVGQFLKSNAIDYPKLDRLRAEDEASGSEYTATLSAYLSAFGNVVAAARRLNVHVTTLRYRLKRIHAISGLDLDDPAERLLCELLLR
ncbi:PucR family transcriptional regulator [Mycolicibacterium baixiangningiae]|uniref:PucR family transcriptional regulator n=1 Tax=Mycolicibacterium baixiangningiae TaxID=2761578 RepID=UPI0018D1AB4B|nr:helix-turn-helix domain-containing protein [Mycolicibacterium baixiangningiae]